MQFSFLARDARPLKCIRYNFSITAHTTLIRTSEIDYENTTSN